MSKKARKVDDHFIEEHYEPSSDLKIKKIIPKTEAQSLYMRKINGTAVTYGIGPAGTGKTWIAAVMAAQALKSGQISKIVVTRPMVEVGEEVGHLPGELDEKYEPYFRPVKDAFVDALGASQVDYFIKSKKIEARPLEFLRGSTLKDSWVIADEMQNSTPTQMKMFLSRIGTNAKFIINGDIEQKDIRGMSGLEDSLVRLAGLPDVAIVNFTIDDIVRSGIAKDIIIRYQRKPSERDYNEGLQRYLTG